MKMNNEFPPFEAELWLPAKSKNKDTTVPLRKNILYNAMVFLFLLSFIGVFSAAVLIALISYSIIIFYALITYPILWATLLFLLLGLILN